MSSAAYSAQPTNQPDIMRERMGLEVIESQLGKIIEHSDALQAYSNQSAKRKFNYQEFDVQVKRLQDEVKSYLDHRPLPRGVDLLKEEK